MYRATATIQAFCSHRWLRWMLLAGILHWCVIALAIRHLRMPYEQPSQARTLAVDLRMPDRPAPAVLQAEPAQEKPMQTSTPPPAHKGDLTGSAPAADTTPLTAPVLASTDVRSLAVSDAASATTSDYPFDPPASARLTLAAQATGFLRNKTGTGQIIWVNSNRRHSGITIEFSVPGFAVKRIESNGVVNKTHGIVPNLYSEKTDGGIEFTTHFQHNDKRLVFSQNSRTLSLAGGEQDTASIIWQLAGIARHSPAAIKPDAQFRFIVANASGSELWLVTVMGLEELDTPLGKLQAWRLHRAPQTTRREQAVDLWLAPSHDWYPVRLRYTEPNGDMLDMLVTNITPEPDT